MTLRDSSRSEVFAGAAPEVDGAKLAAFHTRCGRLFAVTMFDLISTDRFRVPPALIRIACLIRHDFASLASVCETVNALREDVLSSFSLFIETGFAALNSVVAPTNSCRRPPDHAPRADASSRGRRAPSARPRARFRIARADWRLRRSRCHRVAGPRVSAVVRRSACGAGGGRNPICNGRLVRAVGLQPRSAKESRTRSDRS